MEFDVLKGAEERQMLRLRDVLDDVEPAGGQSIPQTANGPDLLRDHVRGVIDDYVKRRESGAYVDEVIAIRCVGVVRDDTRLIVDESAHVAVDPIDRCVWEEFLPSA
jgi:hypothetical protein